MLNEGGGGQIKAGRYLANTVQASEKVYQSYRLEVTNPGGHSSLPVKDNAIYHLAEGLARLAQHDFPVILNEVTRAYFEQMAAIETGQTASDMRALIEQNPPDPAAVDRLAEVSLIACTASSCTCFSIRTCWAATIESCLNLAASICS